ncbi:hydroxyacyl-thioester deHydratase type [Hyphodiscus hymeniophilus]|uniref:Hydroxyacyl-thioester deHydratase type n=1 Tax=Hyphodiscus hymeniophilus TaxID=353542 RepID=A0A9P6VJ04_9HELO|nr:hydroxyacyl-thioester deHydratase type [Hyphodiscus hymeniophilus]
MRSSTLFQITKRGFPAFHSVPLSSRPLRFYSTESLQQSLHKDLTSRAPNIIFDYLSPTPSHLLNVSLADFLPESCYPPDFSKSDMSDLPFARLESLHEFNRALLPQGHHLVYFSPQVPGSELLPDGTDPLQSPGPPFVRRMWAGGSLTFNPSMKRHLQLDTTRATCIEKISDVSVKGTEGDEKVFVSIERRIGLAGHKYCDPLYSSGSEPRELFRRFVRGYLQIKDTTKMGNLSLVETRNLVFMREKSAEAAKADAIKTGKILKPAHAPDFTVAMTPTKSLLFRFSALTFNAHGIHLDPQYAREIEGHRNLLLHGPLSLVVMLSVLRSQLKEGEMVMRFDYKNLAPLYADEELRVCIRKDTEKEDKFDVWIEGKEGGYAVKGSAVVGQTDTTPFDRIDF